MLAAETWARSVAQRAVRCLRAELRLGLSACALVFSLGQAGEAQVAARTSSELPQLRLSPPHELHVGEHARIELTVVLPPNAGSPLLLTPYREGEALEIVRGRLLRSDARDPHANPLTFELPVLASAPGTALIGVKLLAYLCEPRCRAVEVEVRATVVVLP